MNINVIRLRQILDGREEELIKENTNFLEEINNELIDDDLLLVEGDKNAPFSVFFIESGGSESKFLPYFEKADAPILLISNGKNNSLPASLEIKTYCNLHDKQAVVLTGAEKNIAKLLRHIAKAMGAKASLKGNNLGVIGEPSDWLIASRVDYSLVKERFDINLIDISMDELKAEIDKNQLEDIPHKSTLDKKYKSKEVLAGAYNIYSALKRLIKKYDLSGLTIRCFDLLGEYKNTACLALALLNEEGITSACEGDVPSLLTMHLLRALTGRSSFQANPSYMDEEKKTVLFAHCTLPLNMVSKYELLTHFESGLGIGIKGELSLGPVTISKLFFDKNGKLDASISVVGTIKENCSLPGYCRTQIRVELSDYDYFVLLKEDFGNHVLISYGDIADDFYALLSLYNGDLDK